MNCGKCGKNELDQKILNLLRELQLLESGILNKSETIIKATASVNSYHSAISNHINEVFKVVICIIAFIFKNRIDQNL